MSTKDFSETISEGDRTRRRPAARRRSIASERAWERVESPARISAADFEAAIYRPRCKIYHDFQGQFARAEHWQTRRAASCESLLN